MKFSISGRALRAALFLAVGAVIAAGCTSEAERSRRTLARMAEQAAMECPVPLDILGVVDTVYYQPDSSALVYRVLVNEELFPAQRFALFTTDLLEGALRNSALTDSSVTKLARLLLESGTHLKVRYTGAITGAERTDSLTADRIAVIANGQPMTEEDWRRVFRASLELERTQLPLPVSPGMTQTGLELTDSVLTYVIALDRALLPLAVPARRPAVKQAMIKMLGSAGATSNFASLVRNSGLSLVYCFVDSTDRPIMEVSIAHDELP